MSKKLFESQSEKAYWMHISRYHILSEDSIRSCKDRVNWFYISRYQKLSECFIREFQDRVNWMNISAFQKLSEDFIREFQDKVEWAEISRYQKLSECFIREFQDSIVWSYISYYQKLSECFIREFQDKVIWEYISRSQKLSESFIEEFQDKINRFFIFKNQKLSSDFIDKNGTSYQHLINDSWLYKSTEEKKQEIVKTKLYECHEDYFIAYKGIRSDRYSKFNFQYKYEPGGIYESWCDCSSECNSFGLSVWTEDLAKEYCNELIIKVKIRYEDVGRMVEAGKIRCFKIEVLE